jgi:hypothetical protein
LAARGGQERPRRLLTLTGEERALDVGTSAGAFAIALAPDTRVFYYQPPDGEREMIGTWSPAARGDSPQAFVKAAVSITDNPETSERWRAELAAVKLPQTSENEP